MIISILAAIAENGTIGSGGGLPWHLPNDFRRVKQMTTGHTLIMGRKTFESIGKPLPNRRSIVLSRDASLLIEGVDVVQSLEAALRAAEMAGETEAYVFGGAGVFAQALPLADRLDLTIVHATIDGDTHFPTHSSDWNPHNWQLVHDERFDCDHRHAYDYSFRTFVRRSAGTAGLP